MRYVNGVLGYLLVAMGFFIATGATEPGAQSAGVLAIAGAVLIAGERLCNHLRPRRDCGDGNG